jgi:MFS family permease
LLTVQLLDGVANSIWVVVSILVVADRTRGTVHFNLAQGARATAVGLGAALSTALGGHLIAAYSYRVSFYALGVVALLAFALLTVFIPKTRQEARELEPQTLAS